MKGIAPKDIKSINVLKGESAVKKYGDNGVIEVITKSENDTFPGKEFLQELKSSRL